MHCIPGQSTTFSAALLDTLLVCYHLQACCTHLQEWPFWPLKGGCW